MSVDPLDYLQSMFPSIEGDVVAIVFAESDKDGKLSPLFYKYGWGKKQPVNRGGLDVLLETNIPLKLWSSVDRTISIMFT